MNKKILVTLVAASLYAQVSYGDTQSSGSNQLLPPPVSVLSMHKNVRTLNVQGLYMSMDPKNNTPGAMTITGAGVMTDYNVGFSENFGVNLNATMMGMNGKSEDAYSRNSTGIFLLNLNPNIVVTIINGEKKDIAGEVVKSGFSWAAYSGFGFSSLAVDSSQSIFMAGRTKTADLVEVTMLSMDYGTAVEIPLAWWISIQPSYTITQYMSGNVSVGGQSYTIDASNLPSQAIFGTDILVRPLKLNPNLRVSLAALSGLITGNSDNGSYKSTMIMLGIQYEWGKHYTSSFISPGITR